MGRWFGTARARIIAAVVVLVLGIGATVTVLLLRRSTDAGGPTKWDTVMSMIGKDGSVGLAMAKTAFATIYAPLPGVTAAAGKADVGQSGTAASSWILSHWDGLDREERDIVTKALRLEPDSTVVNGMRLSAVAGPRFDGKSCGTRPEVPIRQAPEYAADIPGIVARIEQNLGLKLNAEIQACVSDVAGPSSALAAVPAADTHAQFDLNGDLKCRVTFFPEGRALTGNARTKLIVHELTHCFNRRLAARSRVDVNGFVFIPPWIDEGICNWVGFQIAGAVPSLEGTMMQYEGDPRKPLLERSYDMWAYFQHIHNLAGDMWQLMPAIVGAVGDNYSHAAFSVSLSRNHDSILDTQPSSFLNDAFRGQLVGGALPWHITAAGIVGTLPNIAKPTLASNGAPVQAASAPYGSDLVQIEIEAEVVSITSNESTGMPAFGRFGPAAKGDYRLNDAINHTFCAKPGGCKCPPGTETEVRFTNIEKGTAFIAVTGGEAAATATVYGYSLEKFCKQKKPKKLDLSVPANGCQGNCGGSNGDPHLVTFDEKYYDMQAVGEFTLTKSTVDDFEIQARATPLKPTRWASVNSALAMNVSGDRVGFYFAGEKMTTRVNGSTPAKLPVTLPKGGSVSEVDIAFGKVHVVAWPDGTMAWIRPTAVGYGLVINISLPDSRKGKLIGLLGNFDGNKDNELVTRDGRQLPAVAAFADLYPSFADSWRIKQADSLFDYDPGQTTTSFDDPGFPENVEPIGDRVAAVAACRDAGLTEPVLVQNCIFDIMATGDRGFAREAAEIQRFLTSSPAGGDGTIIAGELKDSGEPGTHVLDIGDSTAFFLQDAGGGAISVCDALITVEGGKARHVDEDDKCTNLRGFGLREKPPGGKVVVKVLGLGKMGAYRFKVSVAKIREFTVKPGELVNRRLEPGQVDIYYLDAKNPVFLSGLPTTCGSLIWEHADVNDARGVGRSPFGWVDEKGPMCAQGRKGFVTNNNPQERIVFLVRGKDPSASGDYSFRVD